MRLLRELSRVRPGYVDHDWCAVATHTHFLRGHGTDFEGAKRSLLAWCEHNGVHAVGIGSPWEPVSAARYGYYERVERDLYYSGAVDPQSVMDRNTIDAFFAWMNRRTGGRPCFYLDNETPKGRYGHLWWFGYNYDYPAWHDYGQDRGVRYAPSQQSNDLNSLTGRPHRRRAYLEVVACQRAAGALGVWAHPTSWWYGCKREFVTNIAAELPLHFWADGGLDGVTVMGYDNCHRWYQQLWFALLDTGARVPGFAETDHCFAQEDLPAKPNGFKTYFRLRENLSGKAIRDGAASGNCFMSTGAFLRLEVDGVEMGLSARSSGGMRHSVRIEAYPRPGEDCFSRIDLLGRGGKPVASACGFSGGILACEVEGHDNPHYLVAFAYGERDLPDSWDKHDISHLAISNPVYLHPEKFAFPPLVTRCNFKVGHDNPFVGGTIKFQDAGGDTLESGTLRAGKINRELPAGARVYLSRDGLEELWFHVTLENLAVRRLVDHLAEGRFLEEYPELRPGQVPVAAFNLNAFRREMAGGEFDLDWITKTWLGC